MKKKKGMLIGIGALVLLIVLYIIMRSMNLEEEAEQEETEETVFEIDAGDISQVVVNSGENSYTFTHEDDQWKYPEDEKFPLSESVILNKMSDLTSITASRIIENPENLEEYGLDSPEIDVIITDTDGKETKLLLGDVNDSVSGCYMILNENTDKVYLVNTSLKTDMQFELRDLAEKEEIPSITGSTIQKVSIESPQGDTKVYADSNSETGWTFDGQDGTSIPADSSMVTTYMSGFSSLSWTDYVSYDLNELSQYGLDQPVKITVDYQVQEEVSAADAGESDESNQGTEEAETETEAEEVKTSESEETNGEETDLDSQEETEMITVDKQMILLIGSQDEDGNYYAKLQEDSCVYTLSSSTVETLIDVSSQDFLSTLVSNYSFADLDRVVFERNGETYTAAKETIEKESEEENSEDSASAEKTEDAESESAESTEDDEENNTETIYTINRKEIDMTSFNTFYSLVSSLEWQDRADEAEASGKPELSINFQKDGGINVTVDYYPYDSNFYLVIDSKGNKMLVNKMKVKEILDGFDGMIEEWQENK